VVLGIGVVREHLPVVVKCDAIRIAQSGGNELPGLAITIGPDDMPFTRLSAASTLSKRRREIVEVLREFDRIAMNGIDHAIGPKRQIIPSMSGTADRRVEHFRFVELIVAIRVTQAIQSLRFVRIYVKTVVRKQQPATFFK